MFVQFRQSEVCKLPRRQVYGVIRSVTCNWLVVFLKHALIFARGCFLGHRIRESVRPRARGPLTARPQILNSKKVIGTNNVRPGLPSRLEDPLHAPTRRRRAAARRPGDASAILNVVGSLTRIWAGRGYNADHRCDLLRDNARARGDKTPGLTDGSYDVVATFSDVIHPQRMRRRGCLSQLCLFSCEIGQASGSRNNRRERRNFPRRATGPRRGQRGRRGPRRRR
jgi:hypothetical protein